MKSIVIKESSDTSSTPSDETLVRDERKGKRVAEPSERKNNSKEPDLTAEDVIVVWMILSSLTSTSIRKMI